MNLHGREIDIKVHDIEPFANDKYEGFKILWSGDIGWGEYTIYKQTGTSKWHADSEHMDRKESKEFMKILFQLLPEIIEVVE